MIKIIKYALLLLLSLVLILIAGPLRMTDDSATENGIRSSQADASRADIPDPLEKNRMHKAGSLWLNLTNSGLIGSKGGDFPDPCTGAKAYGAEMPGGTGFNYMFGGGIMVGAYTDSVTSDDGIIMNGPFVSGAYEGWNDNTREFWPTGFSKDFDKKSQIVETSNILGRTNCYYSPVYDSLANAHEQFTMYYTDLFTNKTKTKVDKAEKKIFGRESHIPLGLEIKQTSYAWSSKFARKFVIVDYTIYNVNKDKKLYNTFVGIEIDADVGSGAAEQKDIEKDDVAGFVQSASVKLEGSTEPITVPLNMVWIADNDGRDKKTGFVPGPNEPLNGATSIFSLRVLRNPNPKLRYSFNIFNGGEGLPDDLSSETADDWGPRWKEGYHSLEFINDPDTKLPVRNFGFFDQYDLSYKQRGYSDGRKGVLIDGNTVPDDKFGWTMGQGGLTEGTPRMDWGRYMVMANGEFDYNVTKLQESKIAAENSNYVIPKEVGLDSDTTYFNKQRHKFRPWTPEDGDEKLRLEKGSGADAKFVVSFGPLGQDRNISIKTANGVVNKKVNVFESGDSIKLTVAFIVSENFHTSIAQDPAKPKLDKDVNWGDVYYNAIWADRLYDVPMYDTEKYSTKTGKTKKDGWFGEDVGVDATFADNDGGLCWWNGKKFDKNSIGVNNFKIDSFKVGAAFDGSATEDLFMKRGNDDQKYASDEDPSIGLTENYGFLYEQNTALPTETEPKFEMVRFGWNDGLLTMGDGVPDFSAPEAPPSPKIKISSEGTDLKVTWTSDNFGDRASSPENIKDKFTKVVDFEGYQIWISDTKNIADFVEIFGVDRKNIVFENLSVPGSYLDMPFLDARDPIDTTKTKAVLVARKSDGTLDSVKVKTMEGKWIIQKNPTNFTYGLKNFGNNKLLTDNHSVADLIDYSAKELKNDKGESYWEYTAILKNKVLGRKQYVAVTSSDFGDPRSGVETLVSSPSMNAVPFVTGKISNSDKVYVVPNPYRADVDYELVGWEKGTDKWRELDRKIQFINIPTQAIIRIYTLSGDLVKTISHNGDALEKFKAGDNVAGWNLLNQNDQAVASGVYLFSVEDLTTSGTKRDKFIGKFVIIK